MYRTILAALLIAITSCGPAAQKSEVHHTDTTENITVDSAPVNPPPVDEAPEDKDTTYHNARFRDVKVKRMGTGDYLVEGEGQIFEASFGWVLMNGGKELKTGYTTTDAGAPAWGKFSFRVDTDAWQPGDEPYLVLFETSMKDGSRQYELPLRLY